MHLTLSRLRVGPDPGELAAQHLVVVVAELKAGKRDPEREEVCCRRLAE